MKTKIVVTVLAYFSNILFITAQVTDNFNDGNISVNPTWTGDTSQFSVTNRELQLNSSGTDSSYLVLPFTGGTVNLEWDFWLRLNFAPSSSNYARVYLSSDQSNLESPLNGYYLQFGESGSSDAIELFRQTGNQHTSIGRGNTGMLTNGFDVKVKVKKDLSGNWEVQTNYNVGAVYTTEITGTDNIYAIGNWVGIKFNYTSSNATKFYFDDFYAGQEILDLTAPTLLSVQVIDSLKIDLHFDEPIENTSASTISNFSISNSIGNPISATVDLTDPSLIHLQLQQSLSNGVEYTFSIQNLADLYGNILLTGSMNFTYIKTSPVEPADVIITEIMADPGNAPSLPNAEYIEIYNRSKKYLSTAGWKLSDGSSVATLLGDTIKPGDYRIYCSSASLPGLITAGIAVTKGLTSFPGLNNDGDEVILTDQQGILLDRVTYNTEYYHDKIKVGGGWAMERIDENFICNNSLNWSASKDARGGSPGMVNSIQGKFSDRISPYLIHATVIDSLHIQLHFSKSIDINTARNPQNFFISNGLGYPLTSIAEYPDYSTIKLSLSSPILKGKIYQVTVSENLEDCPGNKLANYISASFGIADSVKPGNLVINEILFNPKGEGSDFVEVYNCSDKIIDVAQLKLANADPITGVIETIYPISNEQRLLLPGDYMAFTENVTSTGLDYFLQDPRTLLTMQIPSYTDDEGEVVLLTTSLQELDRFHYTADMHFPLLNEVEGISLERINPLRRTNDSTNWHSAAQTAGFATPGYKNSQYFESINETDLLQITPELFSPDNDGKKDVCNIELHTDKPGYYASINIFNEYGVLIKTIAENELLGANSIWSWDGFNENRELAPIGIYVVYLQLVNSDGTVKLMKKPCVLAHRL